MIKKKQYDLNLIINTHWDREYRWSFRETQMRLVEAMDTLLETMEKDERFKYFHTDSQVSMVDDYLELRPENRVRVEKLVRAGRLLVGPWYTLPAEFLVSGEALVRNLLLGHRLSRDLGKVMKAGYNIFSWGQVSQLPQIYRQFGMNTIMFYRGINQSELPYLEFWWQAPDGKKSLGITFGPCHRLNFWVFVYRPYLFGNIPFAYNYSGKNTTMVRLGDPASRDLNHYVLNQDYLDDEPSALKGLDTLLDTVKKEITPHLAIFQGFDQECPDPAVTDLVDKLNKKIDCGKITVSNLPEYIGRVEKYIRENGLDKKLPVLKGEMLEVEKHDDALGPLYPGVFSARMPVKLANRESELHLEKWAEPAAVWAYLLGQDYPSAFLNFAWKELLQNQQHDGIGGCHVDRVTTSMQERYNNVQDISEAVTRNALHGLTGKIDFSDLEKEELGLVGFNSLNYPRTEVVETVLDVPLKSDPKAVQVEEYRKDTSLEIFSANGKKMPVQIIEQWEEPLYAYLKFGSHTYFKARRFRVALQVKDLPGMGYCCFRVKHLSRAAQTLENMAVQPNTLENEYLQVKINPDGTIRLKDKFSGAVYENLHYFENRGDEGGPLQFIPPAGDTTYTTVGQPAEIVLLHSGPLSATYRIERKWLLPAELSADLKIYVPHWAKWEDHGPLHRSEEKIPLEIVTELTLGQGRRVLEFKTTVKNNIKDHRLRVFFPTRIKTDYCWADTPFDVVQRNIRVPDSSQWYESALRNWPATSFVEINNGKNGLAVIQRGIPEYEVTADQNRSVALTLLRCFRTAGNPSETHTQQPLAQCPGEHIFRYAVFPHSGDWQKGRVLAEAEKFLVPVRLAQTTPHSGPLKNKNLSFFSLEPDTLVVTALKIAEDKKGLILRGFNPTEKRIKATLFSRQKVKSAQKVTLEEIKIQDLKITGGKKINFAVEGKEIFSLYLSLRIPI